MDNEAKPGPEGPEQWSDDPANWRLGIFYFNRKDKRLFPPKRYAFGWTVNFANPFSVIALAAVIAAFAVLGHYLGRL